ncbi:MAG TPA: helix-turn-helix domain-containing protein [Natronosporangium sp.]
MEPDNSLEAVGLLVEPVRRAVYEYVAGAAVERGRDEVAEAVGISRSLAAFHLDKLVEAGLLAVTYRRRTGRAGPGAGRPAKLYRRAEAEHAVSVPPRTYETAAALLAEVVDGAGLEPQLHDAARRAGEKAGASLGDDLLAGLADRGYQPYRDGEQIRLRNCPFHHLARDYPPLVCGMNLALLDGLLAAAPSGEQWTARLDPRPGECCVALLSKTSSD